MACDTKYDAVGLLKSLHDKYLIADGLMLSPENERIVRTVVAEINSKFDNLMTSCVMLNDDDELPGTCTLKLSVVEAKMEFDMRVNEWLRCSTSVRTRQSEVPSPSLGYPQQGLESLRSENTSSSSSTKQKQDTVKLRVAAFARKAEKERSRHSEIAAVRMSEAKRRVQAAEREVALLQERIQEEAEEWQRDCEAQIAAMQIETWDNASVDLGGYVEPRVKNIREVPPRITGRSRMHESKTVPKSALDVESSYPVRERERFSIPREKPNDVESRGWRRSRFSLYDMDRLNKVTLERKGCIVPDEEVDTDGPAGPCVRSYPTNGDPRDAGNRGRLFEPTVSGTHDYPPPRPVIPVFDGDPLNYWTFVQSFETHIARRLASDPAKLVYLLQHCAPSVKRHLEHFSGDNEMGYKLARESLFSEYGQPHIVAYCCEKRLLESPKMRFMEPDGLKSLSILMEKSLTMLRDMGDFATLNSLGTMKRLMEKFPEEMQKDWIKWSFKVLQETGKQAKFSELVNFVRNEADKVNSLYGRAFYDAKKQVIPRTKKTAVFSATTATPGSSRLDEKRSSNTSVCPLCEGIHKLVKCDKFAKLSRYKRLEFLKRDRRCFRCLDTGHVISSCTSNQDCTVNGCDDRRHHTLLHKFQPSPAADTDSDTSEKVLAASVGISRPIRRSKPHFMTLPVKVKHGKKFVHTYAMLDSGSQRTFCDQRLAGRLGVKGPKHSLPIQTLTSSGSSSDVLNGMLVAFSVCSLEGGHEVKLDDVMTVDRIPMKANCITAQRDLDCYKHLKGVELRELEDKSVQLLIGLDVPVVFRPVESRFGGNGEPDAIRTVLGWTLFGPSLPNVDDNETCMQVSICEGDRLEFLTDVAPHEAPIPYKLDGDSSREDRIAYQMMKDSVRMVDGHLQLPLLWRKKVTKLPENRSMAEKRLHSLKRRLRNDASLHKRYVDVMQSYIDKGYAELVPLDEISSGGKNWFLPHHPVINAKKPDKLRVVFDCAAKFMGTSLNQALMQGPTLMNSLVGVLIRFRLKRIALASDIEAMFHQVRVDPDDRNALKFLWWPEGALDKDPLVYRMTVHLFGASSSPSCASFCLREALSELDRASEAVEPFKGFYVDDCLVSTSTVTEAVNLVTDLTRVLQKFGFRLTKWLSNSREVLDVIPEEERAKSVQLLPLNDTVSERVLGIHWNVQEDEFKIKVKIPDKPLTRRGILSMAQSLFDPLGFVAPVLLEPRLLLRSLRNRGWDEQVTVEEACCWKSWLNSLEGLEALSIPRCYLPLDGSEMSYEVHHFADASRVAYGAVSYLRMVDKNGNAQCSFLMGKCHLAPVVTMTIPRLELMAAVTAVRLHQTLKKELQLKIGRVCFWSNSTAVLQSIYNCKKRFPVFVANRLAEIETYSDVNSWRYVPTKLNSADEVSRGSSSTSVCQNSRWLIGPEFLWKGEEDWPEQLEKQADLPDSFCLLERKISVAADAVLTTVEASLSPTDKFISSFSSFYSLKRATAWYQRFTEFLRRKVPRNGAARLDADTSTRLSVEELQVAEVSLVKYVQRQFYSRLIDALAKNKPANIDVCSKALGKLSPFIHEEILRVGGWIDNAPVDFQERHPAVLPPEAHLTRLVVDHFHKAVGHSGVSHTFYATRERFWVEKASSVIRGVIDNCVFCRRRSAVPGEQLMADLPKSRLSMGSPPFFHSGVDLFGPLLVKQGRSVIKRYGCLFCCMTTRAIHLEVVFSLSTDSFICALRRFVSRRGNIGHVYSDNGTNFVGANKILRREIEKWNQNHIAAFLQQRDVDWHFNTPSASHFGGAWERLVRSVRRVLNSLSPRQTVFTDESLSTLLTEVEGIVNSRPLYPISFVQGLPRPLSPQDLLIVQPGQNLPMCESQESDARFSDRWRQVQHFAKIFWQRWSKEYLPTLSARQKWSRERRNVAVNDIVIMMDNCTPRSQWPLGRVLEVYPDKKGFVRTVLVKTNGGQLKRPISKLCVVIPSDAAQKQLPDWLEKR